MGANATQAQAVALFLIAFIGDRSRTGGGYQLLVRADRTRRSGGVDRAVSEVQAWEHNEE